MKTVGFIGAYDKTDFILFIAKMLTLMEKSVLVIDTTIAQKAKYIVPVINPTRTYFTQYEDIDVAVGFYSKIEISEYLGLNNSEELDYDYVLIDVDSPEMFEAFRIDGADINFFVTSFDLYSLKRGLEVLSGVKYKIKMIKVIFSKFMSKEENEYLDFLSRNYNIEWADDRIYFPLEQGDQTVIMENQRSSKIKTKNLSIQYRDNLIVMAGHITGIDNFNQLNKVLRKIDKG